MHHGEITHTGAHNFLVVGATKKGAEMGGRRHCPAPVPPPHSTTHSFPAPDTPPPSHPHPRNSKRRRVVGARARARARERERERRAREESESESERERREERREERGERPIWVVVGTMMGTIVVAFVLFLSCLSVSKTGIRNVTDAVMGGLLAGSVGIMAAELSLLFLPLDLHTLLIAMLPTIVAARRMVEKSSEEEVHMPLSPLSPESVPVEICCEACGEFPDMNCVIGTPAPRRGVQQKAQTSEGPRIPRRRCQ